MTPDPTNDRFAEEPRVRRRDLRRAAVEHTDTSTTEAPALRAEARFPGLGGAAEQQTVAGAPAPAGAAPSPAEAVVPSLSEDVAASADQPPAPERHAPATGGIEALMAAGSEEPRASRPHPGRRRPRRQRGPRVLLNLLVVLLCLALGVGVVLGGISVLFPDFLPSLSRPAEVKDYEGDGSDETGQFVIHRGDTGTDIAQRLADEGFIATSAPFYELAVAQNPVFHPGTYTLHKASSASSALKQLQDPANLQSRIEIGEGSILAKQLERIADVTGIPLADLKAAAANHQQFGLPAEAPSLEGYLFPANYDFTSEDTATTVLQRMVDRTMQALNEAGVQPADRHRVLTLAGLVQRESGGDDDSPKIARVFVNRIAQHMLLQSDATVAYGTGNYDTVFTTDAERADASNAYNTYVHEGLPPGPISSPSQASISAAANPAPGSWLYFTVTNLDTGDTAFATTFEEHEANVQKLEEWCKEHGQASGQC